MQNNLLIFYWVTLSINLGVTLVFGFASSITTFNSESQWQLIKIFTTHFTHHDSGHLVGNMLAQGLLLNLFPNKTKTIIHAYLCTIIAVALYAKTNGIGVYLGFSALLYCLPGAYLGYLLRTKLFIEAVIILVILFSYLFMITPHTHDASSNWVPMSSAHLIGFFCGLLVQLKRNKSTSVVVQI